MADVLVRLENGRALRQVARDLRALEDGRELRKLLRKELKDTADRTVQAERSAVRRLPSKGQSARLGRKPLRAQIARATQAKVRLAGPRTGVTIWVSPRRMGPGRQNVPAYMEGLRPFQRWRHPVYGNADAWVTQRPKPWFYRTARPYEDDAEQAAERVITRFAERIERG